MRILAAAADLAFAERLEEALPARGGDQVQFWPGSVTAIGSVEAMAARRPDVVVVGPAVEPGIAFDVAARIEQAAPTVTVVVAAPASEATWRAAVASGVRSVVDPNGPIDDLRQGLAVALETARRRKRGTGGGAVHRVIVIASPKGGVGKTMLAVNTAIALGRLTGEPVAVVDLDLDFGDLAHQLALTPEHSIADASDALPDLDLTALKVFLTSHPSGVRCLTAPEDASVAGAIDPAASASIVDLLAAEFPYVIVDTAGGMDDHALSVMEHATDLVLLSDMDVPSVRNINKAVRLLDLLGIEEHTRHFVLNRANSRVGLRVAEVSAAAGLMVDVEVPSDRNVPLSINEGRPIVLSRPRSPVSRGIERLAQRLQAGVPAGTGGDG